MAELGGVSEMRKYQSHAKKVLREERTVSGLSLKDGGVKQGPFNCPLSIQDKKQKPLPIHDLSVAKEFLYDLKYRGL